MKREDFYNAPKYAAIYVFINKVNGKCYVGQAIKLRRRLLQHLRNYEQDTYDAPIYKAFRKYGLENFEFKILASFHDALGYKTKLNLDTLEKKFIEEYNSYGDSGYNQTEGGDAGVLGYKHSEENKEIIRLKSIEVANDGRYTIYCYDILLNKIMVFTTLKAMNKKLNLNILSGAIRNKTACNRYIIARTEELLLEKVSKYKEKSSYITDNALLDIKSGMSLKEFIEKHQVCKKTYINYKHKIFPTVLRIYKRKVELKDFASYKNNHSVQECAIYFNIPIRRAYKYNKELLNNL